MPDLENKQASLVQPKEFRDRSVHRQAIDAIPVLRQTVFEVLGHLAHSLRDMQSSLREDAVEKDHRLLLEGFMLCVPCLARLGALVAALRARLVEVAA